MAELEEQREARVSTLIKGFQAHCRGWIARRKFKKMMSAETAIRVIQRNTRKYLILRNWPWWKLFTKVAPLLDVHRQEEEAREREHELRVALEKANKEEERRLELEASQDKLTQERNALLVALQQETDAFNEAEQMRNHLLEKKNAYEKELQELEVRRK